MTLAPEFQLMVDSWENGPYVARSLVRKFSGGMLNPKTMANLDSLGEGPERVKFGNRVYYPVVKLAEWAQNRAFGKLAA